MKIVCISDTHGKHSQVEVPDGDILIHAGDFCNWGTSSEVKDFNKWLGTLNFKKIICTAGNHDICLDKNCNDPRTGNKKYDGHKLLTNSIYLENESVEIDGIKFWGSPFSPTFLNWAFMEDRDKIHKYWDMIPADTNVVITHGPLYGVLDLVDNDYNPDPHVGCKALLNRLLEFYPAYHLSGHIHSGYGVKTISNNKDKKIDCINASVVNEEYQVVNKPITFNI